jgi:hypothetical protein
MTTQRPTSTKALNAFLVARGLTLTVALSQVGGDVALLNEETISDDMIGKIARRYGLTFEQLRDGAAAHA